MELVYDYYYKKLQNHFPVWLYYFIFPPAIYDSSSCSTSSLRQCITIFLILVILVSLTWYNLNWWKLIVLIIFSYTFGQSYILLWNMSLQSFLLRSYSVVYYELVRVFLHILKTRTFSDICVLSIFSSCGFPLTSLMLSVEEYNY